MVWSHSNVWRPNLEQLEFTFDKRSVLISAKINFWLCSRVVRLHYRCSHGSIKTQFNVRKTAGLDFTTSNYRKEKTHPNWSETATQIFSGWVNEWVKYMNACNFISDGSQKTNFTHTGLFLVFVPLCWKETSESTSNRRTIYDHNNVNQQGALWIYPDFFRIQTNSHKHCELRSCWKNTGFH